MDKLTIFKKKKFVPREGMKYAQHPLPKRWKVWFMGFTGFASTLYAADMHIEKQRRAMELDTGEVHLFPITSPPDVLDAHYEKDLPMRRNQPWAQADGGLTQDTQRPIRGIEDVEGAPIWDPVNYKKISHYKKPEKPEKPE